MNYIDMSTVLESRSSENFEIGCLELTEDRIKNAMFRDIINGTRESANQKPGIITQLRSKSGTIIMSDTEMERRTNRWFVRQANGHVLIGGLGLGMILLAIQDKPEIESITVIELEQEIIDLVSPQLPLNDKVTILCDDILTWKPPADMKYDTIYFDIWNAICEDNYDDMVLLNRRYGRKLNRDNPACYMSSWRYDEIKKAVLESRREAKRYEMFENYFRRARA